MPTSNRRNGSVNKPADDNPTSADQPALSAPRGEVSASAALVVAAPRAHKAKSPKVIVVETSLDDANPSSDAVTDDVPSLSDKLKAKHARKLLRDGEKRLGREIDRFKDAIRKAKQEHGYVPGVDGREKIKKADLVYASLKHYVKETERKPGKAAEKVLSESFHVSVEQCIVDVRTERARLRETIKASMEYEDFDPETGGKKRRG